MPGSKILTLTVQEDERGTVVRVTRYDTSASPYGEWIASERFPGARAISGAEDLLRTLRIALARVGGET